MASLTDVRMWDVNRGVGHVIWFARSYWTHWLCGTIITGDDSKWTDERPARICRKCRKQLAEATVVSAPEGKDT